MTRCHSTKEDLVIQHPSCAARSTLLRALLFTGVVLFMLLVPTGAFAAKHSDRHHQLRGFSWNATGSTWIFDEALDPDDGRSPANTYTLTGQYSIGAGDTDRARLQYVRTSLGNQREVTELIDGRHGALIGSDSNFGPPTTKAMTSDRLAAILKEQWLMNPQVLLADRSMSHRTSRTGRHVRVNGKLANEYMIHGDAGRIRLLVDRHSRRVVRALAVEHHTMRRDVVVRVDFSDWRRVDGMAWPMHVALHVDGQLMHEEQRSNVQLNPTFAAGTFSLPATNPAPTFDASFATRGWKTSQELMMYANLGFPKDGDHTVVTPLQASPGVWLIQGHPNQSAIVEQSNGLVVFDAALDEQRSEAIIAWARQTFPTKRIKAIHVGHHHVDHAGGTRPYVALGARLFVHESAVPLFRRVLGERRSSVIPDRLDRKPWVRARIVAVPSSGEVVLRDSLRSIRFFAEPTTHAESTIIAHVEGDGTTFLNGDTCSVGSAPGQGGAGCRSTNDVLAAHGITPSVVIGGHGPVATGAQFLASLPPA